MAKKAHYMTNDELARGFAEWERRQNDYKPTLKQWLLFWLLWATIFAIACAGLTNPAFFALGG